MATQHLPLSRFSHYYLGHDVIDAEHRAIYNALIKLWKTNPPDLYPENITTALELCSKHFETEDTAMAKSEFPYIRSHLEVHVAFEERMKSIILKPSKEQLDELINEFLDHIDYYDRQFVEYLIGIQHGFKTDEYLEYLQDNT